MWEYSCKRLKLAPLLGQLGAFLTRAGGWAGTAIAWQKDECAGTALPRPAQAPEACRTESDEVAHRTGARTARAAEATGVRPSHVKVQLSSRPLYNIISLGILHVQHSNRAAVNDFTADG